MIRFRIPLIVLLAALGAAAVIHAEEVPDPFENQAKLRQSREIWAAANNLREAKLRGDWKQVAELWTPDGSYVDARGQEFKGRELALQQPPSKVTEPPAAPQTRDSVRFVSPDVAIVDGVQPTQVLTDGAAEAVRFTAVWVKREGNWLLEALRESAVALPPPHERLEPLEWLLGEWTAVTPDADLLLSSHWSASGAYILRDFLVRTRNGAIISGTQRIGWDPALKQIRSWTFDSAGGSAEATWRQEGKQWIARGQETMPDGSLVQTTTTYTATNDDRIRATIERTRGETAYPKLQLDFRRAPNRAD